MPKRKKLLLHSNAHTAFTGFGKNIKNVLSYLYRTGKYDLVEASNGCPFEHPSYELAPWKRYGTMPKNPFLVQEAQKNEAKARAMAYGALAIDDIIAIEKPDVYIGIEDIWAFYGYQDRFWWNKINCMVWSTLDSLPIVPEAIEMGSKVRNYYVWASFAEQAMTKTGVGHVKTLHGMMDCSTFCRLSNETKHSLRSRSGISDDVFVAGFVFRNQLRKTVGDLMAGLALFKRRNPKIAAKILLHTSWTENPKASWNLQRLMKDFGVSNDDVLTTYVCSGCKNYSISPYCGEKRPCPHCGGKDSFNTTSIGHGVSDAQLNEIYNIMDIYVHPFTSGGQEIPIQEAKLAGLITAVTNYSCGTDMCHPSVGGIPLSWSPYREIGSQFIKASTNPSDICKAMETVRSMSQSDRDAAGRVGRDFIIKNYSIESVGAQLEAIIDAMPDVDYDFSFQNPKMNESYVPSSQSTDRDFILELYKNCIGISLAPNHREIEFWLKRMSDGESREQVHRRLIEYVKTEKKKSSKLDLNSIVSKDDAGRRIALIVPNDTSLAFYLSFFVKSIRSAYPEYNLYVFVDEKLMPIFDGMASSVHKFSPYDEKFCNLPMMEGALNQSGYFEIVFLPNQTEIMTGNHSHNAKDINALCT